MLKNQETAVGFLSSNVGERIIHIIAGSCFYWWQSLNSKAKVDFFFRRKIKLIQFIYVNVFVYLFKINEIHQFNT